MKQRNSSNNKKKNKNTSSSSKKNNNKGNSNRVVHPNSNIIDNNEALLDEALEWKREGNAAYGIEKYDVAVEAYTKGLQALLSLSSSSDNDNKEQAEQYQNNSNTTTTTTKIQLYNNRAMVYIKMKKYESAIHDCNIILDDMEHHKTHKVWYRRALAREGLAQTNTTASNKDARELLILAKSDLQNCLRAVGKDDDAQKKVIGTMAMRLQKQLIRLEGIMAAAAAPVVSDSSSSTTDAQPVVVRTTTTTTKAETAAVVVTPEQQCNNNGNGGASPLSPPQYPIITDDEQREIVLQLLESNNTDTNVGRNGVVSPRPDEAFCLIDWEWWCEWCSYVKMDTERMLRSLSPGARLPDKIEEDEDESDDDDDDGSPGPIDNTTLLLPPRRAGSICGSFYKFWYRQYYNKTNDDFALKPNLVRGYHYEIVPREVYYALTQWYRPLTPPLLRRTDERGILTLYELNESDNNSSSNGQAKKTNGNGAIIIPPSGHCGACGAPGAGMRCRPCTVVHYCDRECQERHWKNGHKIECKQIQQNGGNGFLQQQQQQQPKIRKGLNNLGNTCFMNSAVQSLAHATPLTRYMISGKFQADLNRSNPLGTQGRLASAYEDVMKNLYYNKQNGLTSCSPSTLKRAIAMFAPRFAGCLQHDAQEFLAYLLDGLHEDLNRIQSAPYVELPDVSDGQDMHIAGATAWDAHRRRNDSLILDTFYGQFKSTCVCPKCDRVSVSFDAFNHVSLEIPQSSSNAIVPVLVFGKEGSQPVRYGMQMRRESHVRDLKQALVQLLDEDIPIERLLPCEVWDNKVCDIHPDQRKISELPTGELVVYNVDPFSGPGSENFCHLVAYHRLVYRSDDREPEIFGFPFMSSLTRECTCRNFWEHIWANVRHMVDEEDGVDAAGLLKIRLADQTGRSKAVFETEGDNEGDNAPQTTPFLPRNCDEPLVSFIGPDAMDKFIFVSLDWSYLPDIENGEDEDTKQEPRMDPERFLAYQDHSSWIEAEKKLKAKRSKKGVTLDQCFETFTKPERLDEHNMWYCSSCKEHVCAMKTMELWKLPNVLIIHLKRFEFKHALRRDKLDTLVDFPLDGLDINVHCASSRHNSSFVDDSVPAIYDCFAVVNHFGRMGFGHYTAFARQWDETGIASDWSLFDDSKVLTVPNPKASIVSPAAYVLFYRRRTFH